MAELHYTEYLFKVRGCALGLGDMTWIEPALRVIARSGMDFTAGELAQAYERGGALTPHFLRNMDRGIDPPLAVFDDPERVGPGGMDCAPLWACACPGDPERASAYAKRDAAVDHEGEAVEAARACGMAITVKHNMYDGFKGGIEIPESIEIAKVIESFGVDGIVLSGGFVSKAPMAVMRGLIPIYTMSYYSPLWLRYFIRWCGPFMIKQFPFEECYFLEDAKKFRAALKGPLIYVGGLVSREGIDRALDSGFELVQMARALVNDPAFVAKLREGDAATRSACDHRNYCLARMYSVDLKCCKHCDNLPRRIVEELKRLP